MSVTFDHKPSERRHKRTFNLAWMPKSRKLIGALFSIALTLSLAAIEHPHLVKYVATPLVGSAHFVTELATSRPVEVIGGLHVILVVIPEGIRHFFGGTDHKVETKVEPPPHEKVEPPPHEETRHDEPPPVTDSVDPKWHFWSEELLQRWPLTRSLGWKKDDPPPPDHPLPQGPQKSAKRAEDPVGRSGCIYLNGRGDFAGWACQSAVGR